MIKYFSELIKTEREKKGLSKSELARRTGITYAQLCNIENGMNTRLSTVESLLKELGVKKISLKF